MSASLLRWNARIIFRIPPKGPSLKTVQKGLFKDRTPGRTATIPNSIKLNPTAASLLGFLYRKPRTGWELAGTVQRSIGNFWNLTRSQIYRELHALEAAGMVAAHEIGPRERQPYTITASGRRAFTDWISREPAVENIRFPLLLTVFFADRVPPEHLDRFLRQHQLRHERQLEIYVGQAAEVTDWTSGPALSLKFGIGYERAILRWFAELPQPFYARRQSKRPSG